MTITREDLKKLMIAAEEAAVAYIKLPNLDLNASEDQKLDWAIRAEEIRQSHEAKGNAYRSALKEFVAAQ